MRINLTKKEIINSLYMQIGFSKKISEELLDDFGTFSIRKTKSRYGRNPKTKEKKIISKRNVVLFKPSNDLKNYINGYEKV